MTEEPQFASWYQALASDPDYFTNTQAGQKELAEMIRRESERLLEDIGRSVKRTKEIIWLSRFCGSCEHYQQEGRKTNCNRWKVRLVKPFYGRPIWGKVPTQKGPDDKEFVVEGIDWDTKWREMSDKVIEMATDLVNGGFPYYCFKSK